MAKTKTSESMDREPPNGHSIAQSERPGGNRLLNFSEVARRIGKSPNTVRRWAMDGVLPTVRQPSGLLGVPESVFDEFFSYLKRAGISKA